VKGFRLLFGAMIAGAASELYAQGGPPMITDDPGTPGNGKWEINLAVSFENRPNEISLNLPEIDLNYGVGEYLQLTLQTAPVLLAREGHGPIGGLGSTEAAVKWRFLDEETSGLDMSIFPRITFNVVHSSVGRGLADDGTRFQAPIEIAKKFGRWQADVELGPIISNLGRSEWLYGIVGGFGVTKTTTLMAELQGTSRTNFTEDVLTVNAGLRQDLTENHSLIVSLGHEIRSAEQPRALVGYFGMQLRY